MIILLGGVYLGWALGANDAANVFGTAVASRAISYRRAVIICAIGVIAGAVVQGEGGIHTLSGLTTQTTTTLVIVSVSAAITVSLMTLFGLPISTSQAIVGAIAGVGLATRDMYWAGLIKVVISWAATPIGAMALAWLFHHALRILFEALPIGILTRDQILLGGLVVVGLYGSYALGANNVANATGIFSGQIPGLSDRALALIGGVAIAVGVITFSKRVMMSVGSRIVELNVFNALVAVSAMATTTHLFAFIGVPVSTSQAIVGAVVGSGAIYGRHTIQFYMLRNIAMGWFLTPLVSLILSAAGYAIFAR